MTTTPEVASVRANDGSGGHRWQAIGLVTAIVAMWVPLLLKLRTDWTTNAQYEFGFFVPAFMAFLLVLRWKDRPIPERPNLVPLALAAAGALLFCILPLRIVQEANPDWRPLNWVYAATLVILTLLPAYCLGGRAWTKHFFPPLLLIFVALPWPLAWEQAVIQSLSRAVAAVSTELLNAVGISATQTGNVINVPTGPVGVDDACSGVRSLAGTLMASVFFGEFYRFPILRRVILVVGGVAIALALNFVRAFVLSWIAAVRGIEAIADWHDHAGLLIFAAAFGALWWGAELLSSGQRASTVARPSARAGMIGVPVLVVTLLWPRFRLANHALCSRPWML